MAKERLLVIGIDEFDKMESEDDARRFLNEVKSVFGMPDCFYLVSVSEDAMSSFERRGLPFRDVFDSSFDDIRRVDYLNFDTSIALLRRRVVGMPTNFEALAYVLSGGLPRDLIRVARDMIWIGGKEGRFPEVAGKLVSQDVSAKRHAASVVIRRKAFDGSELILEWLANTPDVSSAHSLGPRVAALQAEVLDPLRLSATAAVREGSHKQALVLALELVSYFFLMATVQEVFGVDYDESRLAALLEPDDDRPIDALAAARQALATSPSQSWRQIVEFRASVVGLQSSIEFPGALSTTQALLG